MGQKLEETITMEPQHSLGHYNANYGLFKKLQEADVCECSLLVNQNLQCNLELNREKTFFNSSSKISSNC